MNTDFAKRTVFVSGGTSGLGAHVSEYFVKLGYSVVICARNQDSLLSKVGSLKLLANAGQQVHGFVCDVSDVNSVATVFEKLKEILPFQLFAVSLQSSIHPKILRTRHLATNLELELG